MSNTGSDLRNAEKVGKQLLNDYKSGNGITSNDFRDAGQAAEYLINDYEGKEGHSSNAVESALGKFGKTDVGRKIEHEVAKEAIKAEAKHALKSGNLGTVTKDVAAFLKK